MLFLWSFAVGLSIVILPLPPLPFSPASLSLRVSFFPFSLFLFHRLLLCALRSIPTLLINKSYPEFLLLAVSSEKLTSYLTAGTQRRRTRTSAVFHSLVFTHAEINFVHFPFPVARRRRGHRDKAALSLHACILTALLLSLIRRKLHHSAIIQHLLYAICIKGSNNHKPTKPMIKCIGSFKFKWNYTMIIVTLNKIALLFVAINIQQFRWMKLTRKYCRLFIISADKF